METWKYSVTLQGVQKQKVDLRFRGEDYNFTSIYLVDGVSIMPVYWTGSGPPAVFWGLLLGLFFAKCIPFVSRHAKRYLP
jgi:hypothetical protein